jgi:Asp-tRNA(Asn)/Glu-tRNA(Gln) amidotransferase A subunit family amidase
MSVNDSWGWYKNSYKVKGLTVAAGSPAFEDLIATDDAFAIGQLRKAGAIIMGLTNMPPWPTVACNVASMDAQSRPIM